jgi:hypothetical protein
MVFWGCITLCAYGIEVYIFYWRLIPFHEDLGNMVDLFAAPRSPSFPKKRGSLKRCALVDLKEIGDVERGRLRVCAICLEEMHTCGKVRETPCGHVFHEQCLQGWFLQGTCCPLCRTDCLSPTHSTSAEDM